jgi:hypothetical protein
LTTVMVALREAYFQERICPAPGRCQSGHPIFSVDGLSCTRMFLGRQDARSGRALRTSHFPSYGARRNADLWIIANAFRLAHVAAGHYVKLVGFLSKPHGRSNRHAVLSKGGQRNVFLTADRGWNFPGHDAIVSFRVDLPATLAELNPPAKRWLRWFVRSACRLIPPSFLC